MGFEPPPYEFIYQKKAVHPSLYGYERKVSGPLGYFREYTYTPFLSIFKSTKTRQ